MPWYAYHRDGWLIAVDAVNQRDAAECIKRHAFGAIFDGEFTPVRMANGWDIRTALVTERRQEQISARIRAEDERIIRENPGMFQKTTQGETK